MSFFNHKIVIKRSQIDEKVIQKGGETGRVNALYQHAGKSGVTL